MSKKLLDDYDGPASLVHHTAYRKGMDPDSLDALEDLVDNALDDMTKGAAYSCSVNIKAEGTKTTGMKNRWMPRAAANFHANGFWWVVNLLGYARRLEEMLEVERGITSDLLPDGWEWIPSQGMWRLEVESSAKVEVIRQAHGGWSWVLYEIYTPGEAWRELDSSDDCRGSALEVILEAQKALDQSEADRAGGGA
jgi:hypothetical protein